jgi:hypothetical protein
MPAPKMTAEHCETDPGRGRAVRRTRDGLSLRTLPGVKVRAKRADVGGRDNDELGECPIDGVADGTPPGAQGCPASPACRAGAAVQGGVDSDMCAVAQFRRDASNMRDDLVSELMAGSDRVRCGGEIRRPRYAGRCRMLCRHGRGRPPHRQQAKGREHPSVR